MILTSIGWFCDGLYGTAQADTQKPTVSAIILYLCSFVQYCIHMKLQLAFTGPQGVVFWTICHLGTVTKGIED